MKKALFGILLPLLFAATTISWAQTEDLTSKRQNRAEVYEFTQKPKVIPKGDGHEISFAVKDNCDVTVEIQDKDGFVVRHLASGVLGSNAPKPFKQNSLEQTLFWDGKDNQGNDVTVECKVRVGLGLKASFNRHLLFDPYQFKGKKKWLSILGIACHEGVLFVFGNNILRAFDKDGNYVRSLIPHAGNLKPEEIALYDYFDTTYGDKVILSGDRYGPFYKGISGTIFTTTYSKKTGKLIAFLQNNDTRHRSNLFKIGLDGKVSKEDKILLTSKNTVAKSSKMGSLGTGNVHVTGSIEGDWVFIAPDTKEIKKFKFGGTKSHAVYKKNIDELTGPRSPLGAAFVGEPGVPGDDDLHFNGIAGIAVDAAGNLFVSDRGNNRIQVFDDKGSLVKSLKVEKPGQVFVHPKTNGIYCLSGGFTELPFSNSLKILKLSSEGKTLISRPMKSPSKTLQVQRPAICLDTTSEPAALWVREIGGYSRIPFVFRLEDNETKFTKTVTLQEPDVQTPFVSTPRVTIDPTTEDVYVRAGRNIVRVSGKTGEKDKKFSKNSWNCESFCWGPDNLLYARVGSGNYGPFIVRCTRDLKPVPFENGVKVPGGLPGFFPKDYKCIWTGATSESNVHQKGFDIAPNGDIYAVITGSRKAWLDIRNAGKPEPENAPQKFYFNADPRKERRSFIGKPIIRVWDKTGKEKVFNAAPGMGFIHGIRVDRDNHLYAAALYMRPNGHKIPEGLVKAAKFTLTMGSVLKFGDGSGELPTTTITAAGDNANLYDAGSWGKKDKKLNADKYQWGFYGMTSLGVNCSCHHGRFDLDGHGRTFIPSMQLFSISILDANGNRILRAGRFGNPDSQGPESLVPDPDLGFAWVRGVAVSDKYFYAMDYGNKRIVQAALTYEVEEKLPINDETHVSENN